MWIDFFWAADRQRMRREFAAVFPEASRDGLPTVGKASRLTPRQCPRAGKTLALGALAASSGLRSSAHTLRVCRGIPEASRDGLPTVGKASRLTPRQCPRAGKTLAPGALAASSGLRSSAHTLRVCRGIHEASRDGLPTVGKASRLTPRQCPRAGKTLALGAPAASSELRSSAHTLRVCRGIPEASRDGLPTVGKASRLTPRQ